MSDEAGKVLLDFLHYQWGEEPGQVYLATLEKGQNFKQYMLDWPRLDKKIPEFILQQAAEGRDVYYCPSLFVEAEKAVERNAKGKTTAVRANIKGSNSFWVDFDNGQGPEDWSTYAKELGIPEPTLVIQSSVKGNQHVYWRTDGFQDSVEAIESVNRALALKVGADRSGWDGNQLLRLPETPNFGYKGDGSSKPWYKGTPVTTRFLLARPGESGYSPAQFDSIRVAEREAVERLDHGGPYPSIDEVLAKQKWPDDLYAQFSMTGDEAAASSPDKRSGAIQKLAYLAAEAGFTDDQIFAVLDDTAARWGKFSDRSSGARRKELFRCIARARTKVGYVTEETLTFAGLMSDSAVGTEPEKYIYRWDEFLTADIKLEWLVEGLLPLGGYGLFTGQPGVGKTQAGLQFCIHLALGKDEFLGWKIKDGAHKALMFSLEMSGPPLQHFALNIQKAYAGLEREIGKNFSVVPLGKPVDILSTEGYNFLDNVLSEHRPELVFIDSLKKIMTKSLNDDEAIRKMNDAIGALRAKHGCAFLVIHHDRKKQNGSKAVDGGELSDMYGSQYIAAESDSVLSFRKTGEQDVIVVDSWKIRLSEEPAPKALRRENLQFTWDEDAGIERFADSVTHHIGGGGSTMGTDANQARSPFGFE